MTLGASLINNQVRDAILDALEQIRKVIGKKSLHCSNLNHFQLIHFAREITKHKMRLFGVISRKDTLGSYKETIAANSSMYYNKCAQYLLERVGWFMEARGIPAANLDIVFERANVDYEKMRNLLRVCQRSPQHPRTKALQNIDVDKIVIMNKNEEPLLQLADLVAHALYKCVDKTDGNYGITEPRYLRELTSHFFGDPKDRTIIGAGLYCVHSAGDLKLETDVSDMLAGMVASPPS